MLPVPGRTLELVVRVVAVEILTATTFTTVVAAELLKLAAPAKVAVMVLPPFES
jgi:hypothetical protein